MKENIGDLVVMKEQSGKTNKKRLIDKREISYDKPSACMKRWETFL